ncbi:MAG: tryptophan-rich sensory protein, partial [Actinobacteria bacterium]|nr:tryptophan-rich sensory protein [Actinomycetota bacterium]
MSTTGKARGADLARQIVVLSAVSFMLIAAVVGA